MTDHYIEHMQDELRRLRQENHLLHAKVASLQAKTPNDAQVHLLLARVTELTARAEAAEAAIQRVRDECNSDYAAIVRFGDGSVKVMVNRDDLLRAMDWGSDE